MKNTITLASLLLAGSVLLHAQETPQANPTGPAIRFEFEEYNFGDINEGDDATVDFVFTNTGTEKLILTDVKASCGCTTPFWSKEPVMPGEKGKITAKYNTQGRPGNFSKAITITSNASEETMRIFIKGNVIAKQAEDKNEISKRSGVPERVPSIVNDVNEPY
ncbi:MAG TPA: DUF1573 domain-containing protein [Chitinophagales bacterium]|nr:DUF1573 domain-containing protein [Chitinophagales bacterium]